MRTTPARLALVTAAVLLVLVVAGAGATEFASRVVSRSSEQATTIRPETPRVDVRTNSGEIAVTPSPDAEVHVVTRARYGLTAPELVQESTAGGVRLEALCNAFLTSDCTVDYEVRVPPGVAVEIGSGSGPASVRGVSGPVRVELGSGDVLLADLSGSVVARTSSGRIEAGGLSSERIVARTSSGDVRIDALTVPATVAAETGSGDVDVTVPGGVGYRVTTDTGNGEEVVAVRSEPSAPRSMRLTSGSGDVTVRPR